VYGSGNNFDYILFAALLILLLMKYLLLPTKKIETPIFRFRLVQKAKKRKKKRERLKERRNIVIMKAILVPMRVLNKLHRTPVVERTNILLSV